MRPTATSKKQVVVPPEVLAALRLAPDAPVQWEVRGNEAVMRAANDRRVKLDDVFGMLKPHLKPGHKPLTAVQMREAAREGVAVRFRRALKSAD